MARVAEEANVNRESLYRTLAKEGNPRFSTLDSVLSALGMTLAIQPKHSVPTQSAPHTPLVKKGVTTVATPFEPGADAITTTSTPATLRYIATAGNSLILTSRAAAIPNDQSIWTIAGTLPAGFMSQVTGTVGEKPSIYALGD
jgi:hypothetical protein